MSKKSHLTPIRIGISVKPHQQARKGQKCIIKSLVFILNVQMSTKRPMETKIAEVKNFFSGPGGPTNHPPSEYRILFPGPPCLKKENLSNEISFNGIWILFVVRYSSYCIEKPYNRIDTVTTV